MSATGALDSSKMMSDGVPTSWVRWIGITLAAGLIGIVAFPWPVPSPEVHIDRFVPQLITVDPRGALREAGDVRVGERDLTISTVPRSQPTVHLLTADVPFTASFSVTVLRREGQATFPFQFKVWNPAGETAVEVWYASDGSITLGTRTNEQWHVLRRLGSYVGGHATYWRLERRDRAIVVMGGEEEGSAMFRIDQDDFPAIFAQRILSLTLYASAPANGSSAVRISDPNFTVPRQQRYGTRVQSPWFRPIVGLAAGCSLAWIVPWIRLRRRRWDFEGLPLALLLVVGASLMLGWWLSRVPGHPLDLRGATTWSAIARMDGPAAITGHSMLATEGEAHGGLPYAPVVFPYPPLLTYLFWFLGHLSPASIVPAFKMLAMIAVGAGGVGIFALLRRLGVTGRLAAVAAGAYLLNPAVLFDAAVWGQTDAFVALFLLAGMAGVVLASAPLLWVGAVLAVLTKQTGALFAPLIILMGLARMGSRRMSWGLVPAVLIVFLALMPAFLSGVHPSGVYRPTWASVLALGTLHNAGAVDSIVSQSALTPWAVVTALEGAGGWARLAFPDFISSRFGVSYFTLSRGVFALFVLVVGLVVLRRRRDTPAVLLPLIAAYAVGAAVLPTRVQPRYLYFGVMFTAAALPWMPRVLGSPVLITLTGTMLAGMWGMLVFTSIWYPGLLPFFDPETSRLNSAAAAILGTDLGITIGGLVNTIALLVLVWAAWRAGGAQPSW
jgi:hypothetical protein